MITDDIIYFAEPMFQDGIVAQAVDQVKARGVSYFSSAQNDGRRSYESPFRPSGFGFNFGGQFRETHDFDPGPGIDDCQQITVPVGEGLSLIFTMGPAVRLRDDRRGGIAERYGHPPDERGLY